MGGVRKAVVREFCLSHGAPTAYWLGRLTKDGQQACIRQWILRVTSPEVQALLPAVAEELFEERTKQQPFFYDAESAEELQSRIEGAKRHARESVDEQIRYGAICRDEIDSPYPWVELKKYHDLCDKEWKRLVGRKTG